MTFNTERTPETSGSKGSAVQKQYKKFWIRLRRSGSKGAKCKKRNGRHEETRTPDLYRVNLILLNTFNNLTGLLGLPKYL